MTRTRDAVLALLMLALCLVMLLALVQWLTHETERSAADYGHYVPATMTKVR